jgi:hypothetical protein
MGIAQFSSGLTPYNQQQMDDIQAKINKLNDYRGAVKYAATTSVNVLAGATSVLLDITGKGYIRSLSSFAVTAAPNYSFRITKDGFAKTFKSTIQNRMIGYMPYTMAGGPQMGNATPITPICAFNDGAGLPATNQSLVLIPINEEIYFDTGLKIEVINIAATAMDFFIFYDLGVTP